MLGYKGGRHFVKLGGIVFLAVVLLISAATLTSCKGGSMCKDLKPVKNLDDLLYQFYVNLDSDCLFKMPTARLEKIWGIKILDAKRLKPGQSILQLWNSADFANKPYHSEKDAFFVMVNYSDGRRRNFSIHITEAYYEKHATLFPDGKYPKLLPEPGERYVKKAANPNTNLRIPANPGVYSGLNSLNAYYWVSDDRARMIELSGGSGSVTSIGVETGLSSNFR